MIDKGAQGLVGLVTEILFIVRPEHQAGIAHTAIKNYAKNCFLCKFEWIGGTSKSGQQDT